MGKFSKKESSNADIVIDMKYNTSIKEENDANTKDNTKEEEDNIKEDKDPDSPKEEVILTNHKLQFSLLACNPSKCDSIRTKTDGERYLILPLFDHNKGLHLLNIGEKDLADCFINKFLK